MKRTDIWFDLHVGKVVCDEVGNRNLFSGNCSKQQLTAMEIKKVSLHRNELHRQLDEAIDALDRAQYENVPYGPFTA